MSGSTPSTDRIVTIDAVRGFAVLGIVAVHMVEQYLGSPPPASRASPQLWVVDAVALGLVSLLFVGKFFAMFSLLFGVSFFIQMDRAASRGQAFAGRFTWRLAVLFAIGMAHHLVYRGDILASYAVMGLVLLVAYRVGDHWLLATGIAVLVGAPRLLLAIWAAATGTEANLSAGGRHRRGREPGPGRGGVCRPDRGQRRVAAILPVRAARVAVAVGDLPAAAAHGKRERVGAAGARMSATSPFPQSPR